MKFISKKTHFISFPLVPFCQEENDGSDSANRWNSVGEKSLAIVIWCNDPVQIGKRKDLQK